MIRTIILNRVCESLICRVSHIADQIPLRLGAQSIDMFESSFRGKPRPQGASSRMSYIGTRIKQRVDLFISMRRLPGTRFTSTTRFNTSFGAFPEDSALEKINFRLKSLEHDWIESEKAYLATQKLWNEVWEELKEFQKQGDLASDEKEKLLQTMLVRSEETVLGSFEMLLQRIQDLHSRLTALLKSARN